MTTDGAVPGLLRERELAAALEAQGYFADEGLCTAIHLALRLGRPLLLEGEPGVGKTEVASVLSRVAGRDLIRLQCFEGLDSGQALYEWDYPKQLLQVRVAESRGQDVGDLYREEFLLRRPLLRAVRAEQGAVLLIDEIDRADSEFEAFLLEFLGDFQITIPELGTIRARTPPIVVLTSNRTRELHDALKRRCLYHWIAFPEPDRERAILRVAVPGLEERAAERAGGGGSARTPASAAQAARHRRVGGVGPRARWHSPRAAARGPWHCAVPSAC